MPHRIKPCVAWLVHGMSKALMIRHLAGLDVARIASPGLHLAARLDRMLCRYGGLHGYVISSGRIQQLDG
jgi:hypothetical protein